MRRLEQRRIQHRIGAKVNRVQALVDCNQEGHHHHSILRPGGGLSSWRRTSETYCSVYPLRRTRTLPQGCTIVSWLPLPYLCIPSLPWLAAVWTCPLEHRESFPNHCLPRQQNSGSFNLRVHAYSWGGLSRGEFSIELGQRSAESKL